MPAPVKVLTAQDVAQGGECVFCEEGIWHVHVYHQALANIIHVTPTDGTVVITSWANSVIPWYSRLGMKGYHMEYPQSESELVSSIGLCRKWIMHHSDDVQTSSEIVERVIGA